MTDQQPDPSTPQDGAPEMGSTPPPPPPPAAPPAPGTYGQPGVPAGQAPLNESDARMWAMLGHLGGIILGFLAPLITWLVFRDRSELVNDQGKEALNFQITVLIGYIVSTILISIVIGAFLLFVVWIASIVLSIMAGLAANRGEHYRYPFALRLIK